MVWMTRVCGIQDYHHGEDVGGGLLHFMLLRPEDEHDEYLCECNICAKKFIDRSIPQLRLMYISYPINLSTKEYRWQSKM